MTQEKVEFDCYGLTLRGDLFFPEKNIKNNAMLFLHGWTGRPNNAAAELVAVNGYIAMTFSFEGHNNSDGSIDTITRKSALSNAVKAYDFLRERVGSDKKIVVVGSSFGSYIATLLTTVRECSDMSLRVPANYKDEGAEDPQYGQGHENPAVTEWRLQKLGFSETKSLNAVHEFAGNIQIIEAELDELIPHQAVQNYVDACPNPAKVDYHLMQGWPHSLSTDKVRNKEFQALLIRWLKEL